MKGLLRRQLLALAASPRTALAVAGDGFGLPTSNSETGGIFSAIAVFASMAAVMAIAVLVDLRRAHRTHTSIAPSLVQPIASRKLRETSSLHRTA